jgi:hypothetical protein
MTQKWFLAQELPCISKVTCEYVMLFTLLEILESLLVKSFNLLVVDL